MWSPEWHWVVFPGGVSDVPQATEMLCLSGRHPGMAMGVCSVENIQLFKRVE